MTVGEIMETLSKQKPETEVIIAALTKDDNKYYVYEIEKFNIGTLKNNRKSNVVAIMAHPK